MTPWMRKLHKWIGLLIALQFLLWMSSGVVMSLLDASKVQGREFRVKPAPAPAWPGNAVPVQTVLAASGQPVATVSTAWLADRPVYRLQTAKANWLVDARTAQQVAIDGPMALQLAQASYSGAGKPATPRLLNYTLETRAHKDPVWRVDFNDPDDTTVYVSAATGAVLEHRNSTWRLFDIVWMLHIMDYSERTNFNNPLLVSSAVAGLWMALSGVWLLFASVRLAEFVPMRWRRPSTVTVVGENGRTLRTVSAARGDDVFHALAREGLNLPSNCGGGQNCGLCVVKCVSKAPAPTSSDRALLSQAKLAAGYRLACNLPVGSGVEVAIDGVEKLVHQVDASVVGVRAVAPFLREVTMRPREPIKCRPGSYIELHIPQYALQRAAIAVPAEHRTDWDKIAVPARVVNRQTLRRSYSVARPVERSDGLISLLVRFFPGKQPGRGSSYVYSLKEGDNVRFSGPFGDFSIQPGGRDKVFIGGGTGMAPLRAMVHALLADGAGEQLHFWYGARTLRDCPYLDEMRSLADRHPNFDWRLVLSEETDGQSCAPCLVHDAVYEQLLRTHPDLAGLDFYLCGPPAMLAATRKMLRELGVRDDRIGFDDFKI